MEESRVPAEFSNAVKLIALFQAALEQMDTLKGTKLYKQRLKNKILSLEKTIETTVFKPLNQLDDNDDMGLFDHIQSNIEMIMDMNIDELSQLKVVLEEERSNEL
jgi:hypothetical protein